MTDGASVLVAVPVGSIIVIWKSILAKFEESVKNIFLTLLWIFFYTLIFFLYLKFSEIDILSFFYTLIIFFYTLNDFLTC